MISRGAAHLLTAIACLALAGPVLTGCANGGDAAPSATVTMTASDSPSPSGSTTASASPTSTSTAEADVPIGSDCKALLSQAVLAQLADQPLNDPAFGPSGQQADGSLVCIWGSPSADTTGLTTTISRMARGPALDMLNSLAINEGFSCYMPDEGTRCEKTFPDPTYPVTDGRTLYWRAGVLIDTRYSNLAPTGYTSSIVEHLFA